MREQRRTMEPRTETVTFGDDEPSPVEELRPGERIGGRYEVRRALGRGGYGHVFEAGDPDRPGAGAGAGSAGSGG